MAITKTYVGLNADGTPHFHYESDGHAVITGPIYGQVTTEDGTAYDVSDAVIEVQSPEHAAEISRLIGQRHAEQGHPKHTPDSRFVYVDSQEG